ncbi:conserved hypothetical protein [uncultured Sporomusa sp.]|uniref:KilA-N domain-containing protein n=1 Tax=uncultured Sporomusa sp. TaxID=307249 RepID=A0A212M1V0_9FIRM|nr:conserved hypothetical protein [uncultured Sporomusa sp.]
MNLTSLWKAAGSQEVQKPKYWLTQDGTNEFISTIEKSEKVTQDYLLTTQRGRTGGTWAHRQIALAYAKYLSPELHMYVNQCFFERKVVNIVYAQRNLTRTLWWSDGFLLWKVVENMRKTCADSIREVARRLGVDEVYSIRITDSTSRTQDMLVLEDVDYQGFDIVSRATQAKPGEKIGSKVESQGTQPNEVKGYRLTLDFAKKQSSKSILYTFVKKGLQVLIKSHYRGNQNTY